MPSSKGSVMTLAKLSGRSKAAAVAKVSSPARNNGASTRSTSRARRSTTSSRSAMAAVAIHPAVRKAPTTVAPDSWIRIGVPVASGAIGPTAPTKRSSPALVRMSPLG
jgi:hypothetical protein